MSTTVERVPLTRRALALSEELSAAARQYGTSLVRLAARSALLRWQRGYGPREALFEGLLDPALPRERWALAVPKHRMMHLQKRFNPREHLVLTEDKVLFDAYCRRLGLPVPRTLAVLRRPSGWKTDGTPLSAVAEWTAFFERELPAEFVVKPADGFWGLGVRAFAREGDGVRESSGRVFSAAELAAELVSAAPGNQTLV
ncbi:MAG: sugar-transfer associated ATP-grasp domain-containing protein, partial [Betaproteobacteria bacterium]